MVTPKQVEDTKKRIDATTNEELKEFASLKHWKDFSLTEDQPEEDIRFFAVLNACEKKYVKNGKEQSCNPLCFSYICEHQNLTDDMIEELMFLSSGIFSWDYYDAQCIKIVADIISVYNFKIKNLDDQKDRIKYWLESGTINNIFFELKLKDCLSSKSPIIDKLDWYNLSKNCRFLSKEFMKKYKNLFEIYKPINPFNHSNA